MSSFFSGDRPRRADVRPAAAGGAERDVGVPGQVRRHRQGRRIHAQHLHGQWEMGGTAKISSCLLNPRILWKYRDALYMAIRLYKAIRANF